MSTRCGYGCRTRCSGHVFVFVNRPGQHLKALYFDHTGYCLWATRLERAAFGDTTPNCPAGGESRPAHVGEN